jgi:hypothetical protein
VTGRPTSPGGLTTGGFATPSARPRPDLNPLLLRGGHDPVAIRETAGRQTGPCRDTRGASSTQVVEIMARPAGLAWHTIGTRNLKKAEAAGLACAVAGN